MAMTCSERESKWECKCARRGGRDKARLRHGAKQVQSQRTVFVGLRSVELGRTVTYDNEFPAKLDDKRQRCTISRCSDRRDVERTARGRKTRTAWAIATVCALIVVVKEEA